MELASELEKRKERENNELARTKSELEKTKLEKTKLELAKTNDKFQLSKNNIGKSSFIK